MRTDTKRAEDIAQAVAFQCGCGKRWAQTLRHYEIVRCKCGRLWWVLQPRRDGPFESFRWPGNYATPATTDLIS